MVILGLTGSIGMGKTTAARALRAMGVPVFDADACVRALLARGGAAASAVAAAFPDCARDCAPDRGLLGRRVFADPAALARLEAILHPLARCARDRFLGRQRSARSLVVVLDIPLLFETGAERLCDAVVVVTAPAFVQESRVLRRPGMTADRLAAIRARQMPDAEKTRRADFIVRTGLGAVHSRRALRRIVAAARRMAPGRAASVHRARGR